MARNRLQRSSPNSPLPLSTRRGDEFMIYFSNFLTRSLTKLIVLYALICGLHGCKLSAGELFSARTDRKGILF